MLRGLAAVIERIRGRAIEVRRALLNRQNVEAEAARARIKVRAGFAALDADRAYDVLRPIGAALVETTPDAIAPTLVEIRDHFASRIRGAEEQANQRLDDELSKGTDAPVVRVEPHLRGRELTSRAQLQAVLTELEERIGPHLDQGARVRIV